MEIDVDDILQYPEDDLYPQDDYDAAREDGERGAHPRRRSSPPAKRRSLPTNELVNKIAHLDEAALDPSLDWYLRIDLAGEKSDLESRERERKVHDTIHRIQAARNSLVRSEGSDQCADDGHNVQNGALIHNYPPRHSSHWMAVTTPSDRARYYVTLKPPDHWSENQSVERRNKEQLLGEDFDKLLAKAEEINNAKLMGGEEETVYTNGAPDSCTVYFTETMADNDRITAVDTPNDVKRCASTLWVDKYKPRGYVDLLSDDGVNRTLLTWLKLWDECVFGRKAQKNHVKRFTGPAAFKEHAFNRNRFKAGKSNATNAVDADSLPTTLDNYKRPIHKIALLTGPPGVGKTTLAHVVARHAGYHVQEMNARPELARKKSWCPLGESLPLFSDDRTLDAFRKQLEGATQMQATLDGNRRPHCLVIDEIDGAPAPSVSYLVSLISTTEDGGGDQESNKTAPVKKRGSSFILRRPIICICNDIYAPALRELRKVALVLHVPPIDLNRLADRLSQISHRESIKSEPGCFELMCTKSGHDVRSCINSLQLLTFADDAIDKERKSEKRLTLRQVTVADVGGKDMQRSLFATWHEIFQIPRVQKRTSQNEASSSAISIRVKNVLTACAQCGEEDRLLSGLFENYLLVDFRDPRLESVSNGLEWLTFVDQLDRMVGETQLYELKRYCIYVTAVFHLLFASRQFTKLIYPQMLQETYFKMTRLLATLQSLMSDVKCGIRSFINCSVLVMDVLPLTMEIIQPNLRPVNVQLYSEQERIMLQRVVNVMRDYNLTYRQQRSVHGQYEFVLEPSVEEIVSVSTPISSDKFDKRPAVGTQKSRLPASVKQVIAHEIELSKVRTKEPKEKDPPTKETEQCSKPPAAVISENERLKRDQNSLKARLFGGAAGSSRVAEPGSVAGEESAKERRVWFRYHEGCNDAIRRFLRITDLL